MPPLRYACHRGTPPLTPADLTGEWDKADWSSPFVDIEGDKKPKPRFETRMKMLWDDNYLYVAAHLQEPQVWATLTEHDSVIFHDNDFEVFIDPDGDAKRYFEFEMNALATDWDLYLPIPYRDGGSADNSWESYAKVATHIQGGLNKPETPSEYWTLTIAFPWEPFKLNGGMPCPPMPGDTWRINFSRVEWHVDVIEGKFVKRPNLREDNWVWTPQGVVDMHQPEQWGFLDFLH